MLQICYGHRAQPLVRSPCRLQRAVQPVGVTCTTMRRAQAGQNRGGSSARRPAQRACSPSADGFPHWSQNIAQIVSLSALIGICSSPSRSMSDSAGRPSVVR